MYQTIERESYAKLFEYIRNDIFPNRKIVHTISLTTKLESFMLTSGIEQQHDSTRKPIRRKLESELGASVQFFPDDESYGSWCVTLRAVVVENQILQRELKIWRGTMADLDKILHPIFERPSNIFKVLHLLLGHATPPTWKHFPYCCCYLL